MAKGSESKVILFNKIMEVFPNSFWEEEGKILRVPMNENGTKVEIKVNLTAAKTNLSGEEPASAFTISTPSINKNEESVSTNLVDSSSLEPTEEEKANVATLLASLGL